MPVFRMDFYARASLENEASLEEDSKRMIEALRRIEVLKNVRMTKVQSARKTWIEYEGNIDIPQGSKAFLAILKRKEEREPYNIFLRIDVNKEADTREKAERETRQWIKEAFAEPLKRTMNLTEIQIRTPLEIAETDRVSRRSGK